MGAENRKRARKALRYAAWLLIGKDQPPVPCAVVDISDTGARIDISGSEELPTRFILMLNGSGKARRLCRAVWRSAQQVGVHFEAPEQFHSRAVQ